MTTLFESGQPLCDVQEVYFHRGKRKITGFRGIGETSTKIVRGPKDPDKVTFVASIPPTTGVYNHELQFEDGNKIRIRIEQIAGDYPHLNVSASVI